MVHREICVILGGFVMKTGKSAHMLRHFNKEHYL